MALGAALAILALIVFAILAIALMVYWAIGGWALGFALSGAYLPQKRGKVLIQLIVATLGAAVGALAVPVVVAAIIFTVEIADKLSHPRPEKRFGSPKPPAPVTTPVNKEALPLFFVVQRQKYREEWGRVGASHWFSTLPTGQPVKYSILWHGPLDGVDGTFLRLKSRPSGDPDVFIPDRGTWPMLLRERPYLDGKWTAGLEMEELQ